MIEQLKSKLIGLGATIATSAIVTVVTKKIAERHYKKQLEKANRNNNPTGNDVTSIAILGAPEAGKTTFWNQLRGEPVNNERHTTVAKDGIHEFEIEHNGEKIKIKKSIDFNGGDDMVKSYEEIIDNDTIIYYLVDLTKVEEKKMETMARLKAIVNIFNKKGLAESKRINLVGSHYDEYFKNTQKSRNEARMYLWEKLGHNDSKEFRIDDKIFVANLTDRKDIEQFYKHIFEN